MMIERDLSLDLDLERLLARRTPEAPGNARMRFGHGSVFIQGRHTVNQQANQLAARGVVFPLVMFVGSS
jgi:hypothetical protein